MTTTVENTINRHSVDEILDEYRNAGCEPDFGPEGSRLLVRLYRLLASTGQPIPLEQVVSLAGEIGMSRNDALKFLENTAEQGDDGEVRGLVGLSLNDHPHRLTVQGNALHTWCALDPLFIVPALGQAAVVESQDPKTEEPVKVTISAEGGIVVEPTNALLSLLVPAGGETALDSVEDIWMQFCQHVHFFVSAANAESFLSERQGNFELVSVADGFEIGRSLMAKIYA